mmetsp:Transcript_20316/g.30029  ORF Transcript_20316/g.30029 Transcript_20316/m.30029 type:complete len:477 (-) Transcript_20316:122-1552(-)|eukprot:CAMPEP_0171453074 /NCGR_PEP_ID=MMETSP0945-20130129/933_1 /TAXON_ID=109269 /ORGANISM="Vaucheria litorea, Strain CCMP2940" /LENGTH=476 /DNA_ID=CAMNT_0011977879 /DNA_START=112 /DNA_END=1542 /DNA_ORIENTATION=+
MFNFLFQGNLGELIAPIQSPEQQLLIAIQNLQLDKVRQMLEDQKMPANCKNQNGVTPLHMASQMGLNDLVRRLIELGADLNAKDNNGNTAMHFAAKGGKIETVRILVDMGLSSFSRNSSKQSPYDLATNHVVRQYLLPLQLKGEASSHDALQQNTAFNSNHSNPIQPPPNAALEALMQASQPGLPLPNPNFSSNTSNRESRTNSNGENDYNKISPMGSYCPPSIFKPSIQLNNNLTQGQAVVPTNINLPPAPITFAPSPVTNIPPAKSNPTTSVKPSIGNLSGMITPSSNLPMVTRPLNAPTSNLPPGKPIKIALIQSHQFPDKKTVNVLGDKPPPSTQQKANEYVHIKPDGFHSSASDKTLQMRYGHTKVNYNLGPPPTAHQLGNIQGYGQVANTPSTQNSYSAFESGRQARPSYMMLPNPVHANSIQPTNRSNIGENCVTNTYQQQTSDVNAPNPNYSGDGSFVDASSWSSSVM